MGGMDFRIHAAKSGKGGNDTKTTVAFRDTGVNDIFALGCGHEAEGKMQRIVGLVGHKESGKSTVAQHLTSQGFAVVPFAKPLKDMLRAIGLEDVHLTGSLKEKPCHLLLGRTPRWAMQTLGTDWARNTIHPDLWVHLWREAALHARTSVVADDVRFENEAATIRRLGGTLVRITRVVPDYMSFGQHALRVASGDSHASEVELDSIHCDAFLENNGTIDDLLAAVDVVLGLSTAP